uniref:Cell division protein SepF n=1 Tax=Syphacia muris TaxID=451379 RepID=A0A0N5AF23_9BILA
MNSLATYYTAKETFDNEQLSSASQATDDAEDLDETLRDYDDRTLTDFEDIGFNRSQPQRMSSFRNDPTAPTDSPLYRKRQSRSPKPVTSPSSPL